jgi:hypothetical protein
MAMLTRKLFTLAFILLAFEIGVAQTSYKGLTPGKSTRADVQRVLGQPVTKLSETLIEYRPQPLTGKILVQYGSDSVIERLEFYCRLDSSNCDDLIKSLNLRLSQTPEAARAPWSDNERTKTNFYFAQPFYVVTTHDDNSLVVDGKVVPDRIAFYSRELYAPAVSKTLQELGVTGVDSSNPGYDEVTGVVKLRTSDGPLRPAAGAAVTFCWAPTFFICYSSTKTDSQGKFSYVGLRGTYVAVVTGPGLKWTHKEAKVPFGSDWEIVAEAGDGKVPTSRDLENATRKGVE